MFEGLSAFLEQQWQQLNAGEKWVLTYLAMSREPVTFKDIKADCLDLSLQRRLTEVLASLSRQSFVEQSSQGIPRFGLQTAILEYATFRFTQTFAVRISPVKN